MPCAHPLVCAWFNPRARDRLSLDGIAARTILSTAGGNEKRLQCAQANAEGERYATSGVTAAGEDYTGCRTFPMPVGLPAGHWNVTVVQMAGNRGRATTAAASRQVDLVRHTLYDLETLARVYSVRPTAGSLAGGTVLTVRGTGFGNDPHAVEVTVGGVRAARVEFVDPTAEPSDTMLVTLPQITEPLPTRGPLPRERGVRLLMMHENDLFGELLDRWRLGRVEKWCRREWCGGFDW